MTSYFERNKEKHIDGANLAKKMLSKAHNEITKEQMNPRLAAVIVGMDPGCYTYQHMKERKCAEVGIRYSLYAYPVPPNKEIIKDCINDLNNNDDITGVMVQLPLPPSWNENEILELISSEKDVDGLNYENVGRSYYNSNVFVPCAAEGVMLMLKHYNIPLRSKKAVVLGRGRLLGTPVAQLLEKENAYVTKIHSVVEKADIERELKNADIILSCTGKPGIIDASMLKKGCVTIDCSNTRSEREFNDNVFDVVSHFATTPGGVGPMTIAVLISNTIKAYRNSIGG